MVRKYRTADDAMQFAMEVRTMHAPLQNTLRDHHEEPLKAIHRESKHPTKLLRSIRKAIGQAVMAVWKKTGCSKWRELRRLAGRSDEGRAVQRIVSGSISHGTLIAMGRFSTDSEKSDTGVSLRRPNEQSTATTAVEHASINAAKQGSSLRRLHEHHSFGVLAVLAACASNRFGHPNDE